MHVPEQDAPRRVREPARDRPEALEGRRPALLLHLALDRAPEHVQQLGHEEHRRDPVLPEAVEDDARVPAPDVEDVRAHVHRVEQRHLLLQAVREREQRHEPVLHRPDDAVERLHAGERVLVGEHHALGAARGARREHELVDVCRARALPCLAPGPPSPAGTCRPAPRTGCLRGSSGRSRARPPAGRVHRDRVPSSRRTAPEAATMFVIASGGHPRVQRHVDEPRVHRAVVRGRAAPAWTVTRSGLGRPAAGRARAAARRRDGRAARPRDSSSGTSCRRRGGGPARCGPRTALRCPRADRAGSPWSGDPSWWWCAVEEPGCPPAARLSRRTTRTGPGRDAPGRGSRALQVIDVRRRAACGSRRGRCPGAASGASRGTRTACTSRCCPRSARW